MSWLVLLFLALAPAPAQKVECAVDFGPPDLPKSLLEKCDYVGWLESIADLQPESVMDEYQARLAEWRKLDMREQPACRLRPLSVFLLNGAKNWQTLFRELDVPQGVEGLHCQSDGEPPAGEQHMCQDADADDDVELGVMEQQCAEQLLSAMSHPAVARCFAQWYAPHDMQPRFFWFPELELSDEVESILADREYDSAYAAGGHLAPHYGAPQVHLHEGPRGRKLRSKRAIHLVHYRNMRGVFKGFSLELFSQVWEFGVGQGDLIAMLRDLGYKGTYLGYDLFPVLLFAGYWLRYSGLPALLGAQLPPNPEAVRNRTVLESSSGTSIFKHLDRDRLGETLFVAFESFSEARRSAHVKVWPWIRQCGFIMMTFEENYVHRYNVELFASLAKELEVTHNVLVWRKPKPEKGNATKHTRFDHSGDFGIWVYFAAVRKDLGEVACAPPSSCTKAALHPAFHPADSGDSLLGRALARAWAGLARRESADR